MKVELILEYLTNPEEFKKKMDITVEDVNMYDGVVDVKYLQFAADQGKSGSGERKKSSARKGSDSFDYGDDDEDFVEMYHDDNFSDDSQDTVDLIGETKEGGRYQKPQNKKLMKKANYYSDPDFPTISERAEEYDDDISMKDFGKMKVVDSYDHRTRKVGERDSIVKGRKAGDKKRRMEEAKKLKQRKLKEELKKKKKRESKAKKEKKKKDKKEKKKRKKKAKKEKKKRKKKEKENESGSESESDYDSADETTKSEREEEKEELTKSQIKLAKKKAKEEERKRIKEQAKKDEEKKYQIFEYDVQDNNMNFKTGIKPKILQKTNIGHSLWLSSVVFIPEKDLLVTGGYDDFKLKIWRLNPKTFDLSKIAEYRGHGGHITMILHIAHKEMLIVGSQDCSFSIIKINKIKKLEEGEEDKDVLMEDDTESVAEIESR